MLSVKNVTGVPPFYTLQGSYDLYIDIDCTQSIVAFEAVAGSSSKFWNVKSDLIVPTAKMGQVYLKQDVDDGQEQTYFTNDDYSIFYTQLGKSRITTQLQHVAISNQIILDITDNELLCGIWMLNLPPEIEEKNQTSTL